MEWNVIAKLEGTLSSKFLPGGESRFLEGAPARFPPSEIVQNDDRCDLARTAPVPTAGRVLDFDSLPDLNIIPGCGVSTLFGMVI